MTDINPTSNPSVEEKEQVVPEVPEEDSAGKKTAEVRIQQILAKNKQLESELEDIKVKLTPPPAPQNPDLNTPQVKQAADFLKQMGFVNKEELAQRDRVMEDRLALNNEHGRLEGIYSGQDGRPKYDRSAVEKYMRDNGIFGSPEAAYKLMNEPELLDWTIKQAGSKVTSKAKVIRPSGQSGAPEETAISREKLDEVMKNPTPDNRIWYEQNRAKILDLMAKGQL